MSRKKGISVLLFTISLLVSGWVHGQISAPGASSSDETSYPVFSETDSIFVFCAADSLSDIGILQATTQFTGAKTFLWEKYNDQSAAFDFYFSENSDSQTSEISGLGDGCYRVTVTQGANSEVDRAWVFNNWTFAEGDVTESNCDYLKLSGNFTTAHFIYYDLADNTELEVFKDVKVRWNDEDGTVSTVISPTIYDPPAKNTNYTFEVYDKFGCSGSGAVFYESIVTKAAFSVNPQSGGAPLTVNFINESENGDPGQFEWFLYRDLDEIKRESEGSEVPVDSIMIVAYDDNPEYTYENSGMYNVKLVSKHISEFQTCTDTAYIEDYIVVDTSFIAVPNVFTPNGDGTNDFFVVQFWSMKSIKIAIFNRWGKRIHFWKSDDVGSFEEIWEETVWDGRLMGGRYASPGVYYYTVVGEGRDGEQRRTHGFFHLFRGKD